VQEKEGLFIAIEGTDGSGKGTQFNLLIERLELAGYEVATFDFPRYDEPSSYFVKEYLNGKYGTIDEVGPYTASLFYALDRYEAAPQIRQALREGKIVLANRFTGSNMAHQGTKFRHADERRGYFIWLDNLEFEMLRIPRPNLNLVLRVPADIAQQLVEKKDKRGYTDKKFDLHEADSEHLQRAVEVYDDLTQLFPKDYLRIDCVRNDQLLPFETISNLIWEKVFPFLPKPSRPRRSAKADTTPAQTVTTENPYIENTDHNKSVTDMGREYLEKVVTDTSGPVYAFTSSISPATVAAAMARLSRRREDMRVLLLDEFAHAQSEDEKMLQRVLNSYGDDSVRQLTGLYIVVEGASNLLTKKLEWGRLGTYLEQSSRYMYFDQKDANGRYKYYVPEHLAKETKAQYRNHMDKIFDIYSTMVRQLTHYMREKSDTPKDDRDNEWKRATRNQACDVVRAVLPVATKSTVCMYLSTQAIENLIIRLQSDKSSEAQNTGTQILKQARKIIPEFLERVDMPEAGGAASAYLANTAQAIDKLVQEYLPDNHTAPSQNSVELIDVWPRNELQLVPDMLYEKSNLSLSELQETSDSWPYNKKANVFSAYMGERLNRRQRPGRALEKAHYSWDIISEYGVFYELQRHRMVDDLEWQQLTPRFGYEMPELVDEAGLSELYEDCFDTSLKLHSILQQAGYPYESQYATLLGHKMRWKVTYNAREAFHIHELRTSPYALENTRKLVLQMHEKLTEKHPMLGDAMKFVGTNEDPELARLAAERYTQFKLKQLDNHAA
jgi:thymidylate kinase/thymidylate synthase ThyX